MIVCSHTNTIFLHKRRAKTQMRRRDGVAPSPSRKTRPGDESHHKDRGGRPRSTRAHAVAARPSTRPAGAAAHALFKRTARRPHIIPQSEPTTSSQPPKSNTRRERLAQARTTNQGPGPPPPRRPLHAIERPANKAAPPKREADAAYPPQHTRSALKNMSVERGKARPAVRSPFNKADAASYSPKPQPSAHTPSTSADPRRRRATSVPTTTTENATARAASTPSRGKRPPEPAPVPRAKRATARSTPVAPLAQARRRRVTCLELADRFATAKPLNDGRTEPFRTSRRARWCAARGPSRRT